MALDNVPMLAAFLGYLGNPSGPRRSIELEVHFCVSVIFHSVSP